MRALPIPTPCRLAPGGTPTASIPGSAPGFSGAPLQVGVCPAGSPSWGGAEGQRSKTKGVRAVSLHQASVRGAVLVTERPCWPQCSHGQGQAVPSQPEASAGRPGQGAPLAGAARLELLYPNPFAVLPKAGQSRPKVSSLCPRAILWAGPMPTIDSPSGSDSSPCVGPLLPEGGAPPAEGSSPGLRSERWSPECGLFHTQPD